MPLEDIRRERLKKLEAYRAAGLDPYPASVNRSGTVADIRAAFARFAKSKKSIQVAGRLRAWREHGGVTFGDLEDPTGKIQLCFSADDLGAAHYRLLLDTVDIGDFLQVSGRAFRTARGEPTIRVAAFGIIAKGLRPLPEKWHGLKDIEERFRRRYLDLLMNQEVRRRFETRTAVVSALRAFFNGEGFLEVETPMLHPVPGGALARPFKTRHQALGVDLYLRVAPELYLKRLLVGGFEKVYELGKNFRNEGIDAEHNPEFTSAEWYAAYWDETDMMANVERLMRFILRALKIKKISFEGKEISFAKAFPRITFKEVLKRHALIVDYEREDRESLVLKARQFGIEVENYETKARIADEIYKKICRPRLIQPTFVISQPIEISPLAKRLDAKSREVRRFQLVVGGFELVNAFSELNDPLEQRARFEEENEMRRSGDPEAHATDEDFLEAVEYGMPPSAGAGLGVDRLVMLLTGATNIREVVLFPTLKPK